MSLTTYKLCQSCLGCGQLPNNYCLTCSIQLVDFNLSRFFLCNICHDKKYVIYKMKKEYNCEKISYCHYCCPDLWIQKGIMIDMWMLATHRLNVPLNYIAHNNKRMNPKWFILIIILIIYIIVFNSH